MLSNFINWFFPTDSQSKYEQSTNDNMVRIFYGSQTGTAKFYSLKLSNIIYCSNKAVKDIAKIQDLNELKDGLNLFIISTCKIGQPPDSCLHFIRNLQRSTNENNIKFAIFGIGDSQYSKFNAAAKHLSVCLLKAFPKGTQIVPLSLGDCSHGIESQFFIWIDSIWDNINELVQNATHWSLKLQPSIKIAIDVSRNESRSNQIGVDGDDMLIQGLFNEENPYMATVIDKRQIFKESSNRRCWEITFDLNDSSLRYQTGDHCGIHVTNSDNSVSELLEKINFDRNCIIRSDYENYDGTKRKKMPSKCSLLEALTNYLDINGPLNISTVNWIMNSHLNQNESNVITPDNDGVKPHKEMIKYQTELHQRCSNFAKSLKCRLNSVESLGCLDLLKPRLYAIASSTEVSPRIVKIIVTEHILKDKRQGVATAFFDSISPNVKVPIFIRRSDFKLPLNHSSPVVMVGCGTGVASFIAFINARLKYLQLGVSKKIGHMYLYRGCRLASEEFTFDEINNSHVSVKTAYSREKLLKRQYVTDLLIEDKQEIWTLIKSRKAAVYVSGGAPNLSTSVLNAFKTIATEEGKLTETCAIQFMENLINCRRYQEDIWS